MLKKTRLIVALSLMVQSITFFVLFFLYADKKRSLSKVYLGCGVAGLIGGSYLLYKELKAQKELKELHAGDPCYECEDDCSDCPEAFFEEDDELNCAFVDDDDKVQELIVEEEA